MFLEILGLIGISIAKNIIDNEKGKNTRLGKAAKLTEMGAKKLGNTIIELNEKKEKEKMDIENEKIKMIDYSEERLLKEIKIGSREHKIAAKKLLQENYGYGN